jgi:MFS family permease
MSEERDTHTEEQPNEPRFLPPRARRRQTRWWVLWAVGMVISLVAIGLLVAKLYPDIWETPTRGRVATLIGIVVFLTGIIVLLIIGGASLGWTGFGGKKLWDWQGLLFVPITVALIASLLTLYQTFRQQNIETQRAKEAQQLETQRAREAQKLEAIRAERAMVQAYLEHMGMLLLEKNLSEVKDDESAVRLLARARTLAVLDGVSGDRKVRVLEFLFETQLRASANRLATFHTWQLSE